MQCCACRMSNVFFLIWQLSVRNSKGTRSFQPSGRSHSPKCDFFFLNQSYWNPTSYQPQASDELQLRRSNRTRDTMIRKQCCYPRLLWEIVFAPRSGLSHHPCGHKEVWSEENQRSYIVKADGCEYRSQCHIRKNREMTTPKVIVTDPSLDFPMGPPTQSDAALPTALQPKSTEIPGVNDETG